jgi:thiamine biosynthesis lipoprotein
MNEGVRLARTIEALEAMGFERAPPEIAADSFPVKGGAHRVCTSRPAMGTLVSIIAIHPSVTRAEEAMGRAFERMDRLVAILNRHDSSSALTSLNVEGRIAGPPPELSYVVSGARRFHDLTRGAFDVTVQPVVDLLRSGGLPELGEPPIREAMDVVDGAAVRVQPRSISFAKAGMGITLDGIAKGFVVDRMADDLEQAGIADFLINAGGDIRVRGTREDGSLWRVAVQDPMKEGAFPDLLALGEGAVATSGSYEIYFDGDRTRHHIVSGRQGSSPQESQSVTVVAPSAMEADALATAVFVMGPAPGVAFINRLPGCGCLIIDEAGRPWTSRRWRSAADEGETDPRQE